MKQDFSKYGVLTFDCYGTLIDWERGIWDAFQPVLNQNNRMDHTKDSALQEFASLESALQSATPGQHYSNVLKSVHAGFALNNQLVTTDEMNEDFANSIANWPPFADSPAALRILKKKYKLVILSRLS